MACPRFALTLSGIIVVPIIAFALLWASLLAVLGLMWVANATGFI